MSFVKNKLTPAYCMVCNRLMAQLEEFYFNLLNIEREMKIILFLWYPRKDVASGQAFSLRRQFFQQAGQELWHDSQT